MKALVLIDLQQDFLEGGTLAVPQGTEILPLAHEMVSYPFDLIVATKDWHPLEHSSFASNHAGAKPGEHLRLGGFDQTLWPIHCVQGTTGAEFAPGWDSTAVDKVFYKGMDPLVDSYSAFFDNGHVHSTGLENYLREKGVRDIFFAGLATDYCVKYSVLDALGLGFHAYVVIDACRGINLQPHDVEQALLTMQKGGATLLSIKDITDLLFSLDRR